MGIYIKDMEMPKSCFYCPFREKVNVNPNDYVCMAMNREVEETFALILGRRHKDCPLVEVPDHGDLIDRDEMAHLVWYEHCYECKPDELEKHCESCMVKGIIDSIVGFPVVISAERRAKDEQKLKPCPFCGDTYILSHITKGGNYIIGCNTVNCVGLYSEGKLFKSEEEAIESWNRRAE